MPILDILGDPLAPFTDLAVANNSTATATDGVGVNAVAALVALFEATPSLAALTSDGKLHYVEAPEGTALPFAVIVPVAGPLEELTASDRFELVETVQVSYRAAGALAARQGIRDIRRAIRFAPLAIGGQATRSVYVVGAASDKYDGRTIGAKEAYFESVDFEIAYGTDDDAST